MFREAVRVAAKFLQISTCVAVATFVIWRGNTFSDASGRSHLLIPVMCVTCGVILSLTGLALGMQGDE